MKKVLRISSILLLLIVACCPLLLLSGCDTSSEADAKTTLSPLTGWTFKVGDELKDAVVTNFKGTVVTLKYDSTTGKNVTESKEYNSVAAAYEAHVLSGTVDTTTATASGEKRTAFISFGGSGFTITYTVTGSSSSQNSGVSGV